MAICVALAGGAAFAAEPPTGGAGFDIDTLRERGIDPSAVASLGALQRYSAGAHEVTVSVNGQTKGRVEARFFDDGSLCFDAALLQKAGLRAPKALADNGCYDFIGEYPQTVVEHQPNDLALSLIVPTSTLAQDPASRNGFGTGGVAGMLNYNLIGMVNSFGGHKSSFYSGDTEVGFNAGDWIVRSQQSHSLLDGQMRTTHLAAYAQKTFTGPGVIVQAGEINLANPVLAGAQITGVQVMTESALDSVAAGASVSGLAFSQAKVEVFQDGALIHTAVVPAGDFTLTGIRRLNSRSDLEVVVTEADGSQNSFVVPAALAGWSDLSRGFSVGAGQVRNLGTRAEAPWVASGGWTGSWGRTRALVGFGGTLAQGYAAAGASVSLPVWADGQLRVDATASSSSRDHGVQLGAAYSQNLTDRLALSATASLQSKGYRELLETFDAADPLLNGRRQSQLGASLNWNAGRFGRLGLGYTTSRQFSGEEIGSALVSWGATFGKVSVAATGQWSTGGAQGANGLYVNVSIPLDGSRSLRATARRSDNTELLGLAYNHRVNDAFSYRVGVEHDAHQGASNFSAGASLLPRYTQLDFNYNRMGNGGSTASGSASGGLVWTKQGITLSPYRIQDTFGVISAGSDAGIKFNTPSGPVWTDAAGRAVVAQLNPYADSFIEVDTRSLGNNDDIDNGAVTLSAGRGSVQMADFGIVKTRRLLLMATDAAGKPLPGGAAVTDDNGNVVSLVSSDGAVFVPNALDERSLWVHTGEAARCRLSYELPREADGNAAFETIAAQCRAQENDTP